MNRHITPADLADKTIDCHTHLGISAKAVACGEYPYGQSIEGLYYRMHSGGVDTALVFPCDPELYFDLAALVEGRMEPAKHSFSPAPYVAENRNLMNEVFRFCPEYKDRFIPFVSVDPGRMVYEQVDALQKLEEDFPIYGIKVVPVSCQTPITELLRKGRVFLDFARERNIPFLFHTTVDPQETYSHARMAFEVIDSAPELRFCLAHCVGFHRGYLDRAAAADNIWVDTSAMAIQVQAVLKYPGFMATGDDLFAADYTDHTSVMRSLVEAYLDTILWGSDSPFYSYISRRKQGEAADAFMDFDLKASYEDEKAALDALSPELKKAVSNTNTIRFLFGK
ncbi:MAG: amidohydrolase family protein [Pirellulales bacterium]|nr:amidohydrolase family protein [Pirellulales bacterium]